MQAVESARAQFHRMPDAVFDAWLRSAISERGWPFLAGTELTAGTAWEAFFLRKGLKFWTGLSWSLKAAQFEDVVWSGDALERANALAIENVTGRRMFDLPIENSRERFEACIEFIAAHRRLPAPLVCVEDANSSWHLVDGHHRMAALISAVSPDELDEFEVNAWVGVSGDAP